MYNNDSDSLDTGAPDITITGNQNPNTQMASYGYDEAMAESRQAYDDARKKGVIPIDMEFEDFLDLMQEGGFLEGRAPQQNSGIMAAGPGTYTQNRKRQMAAGGGIMGSNAGSMLVAPTADGSRPGYGWLSDAKDKLLDLIPNEIKDPISKVIPNELKNPVVAATVANYLPLLGSGNKTLIQKGLGALGVPDKYTENNALDYLRNIFTGGSNVGKEEIERVIGENEPFDIEDFGDAVGRINTKNKEELSPFRKALATILPGGNPGYADLYTGTKDNPSIFRSAANIGVPMAVGAAAGKMQQDYLDKQPAFPMDETGIDFQTARQAMDDSNLRFKPQAQYANVAEGGRIGYALGSRVEEQRNVISSFADYKYGGGREEFSSWFNNIWLPSTQAGMPGMPETARRSRKPEEEPWQFQGYAEPGSIGSPKSIGIEYLAQGGRIGYADGTPNVPEEFLEDLQRKDLHKFLDKYRRFQENYERRKDLAPTQEAASGGRIGAEEGGLMNLGGMEKDYRNEGGFVPIGGKEKADDVPARLSRNEFVFTADAVRGAGGGDIDQGAEIMENMMKHLEAGGEVSEDSQGLEGARGMFANAQQLQKRII